MAHGPFLLDDFFTSRLSIFQMMISRSYVAGKQDITLSCMLVLREFVWFFIHVGIHGNQLTDKTEIFA